ncbi:RICIN domain-containing protein [Streptomyces sp. NBC_01218]|nr:RICIN domain-containing protein [Streptomyces sp. AM 2-1-1]WEH43530.1 RICIN domain-containing protein [Streptomyces sp. AM 2-1-1]WSQ55174.1 RICIN domain-containing protein [Streptomyces sp. NBC_01218]
MRYGSAGYFRIRNANGGRVLGVLNASTAQGAQLVQGDDNGADDHLWRFV